MSSDDSKSSGGKIAIIVALIGLFGTLLTVVINNWDKIFHSSQIAVTTTTNTDSLNKSTNQGIDTQSITLSDTNNFHTNPVPDYNIAVTAISQQWLNDIHSSNIDNAISISTTPFLFHSEVFNNLSDVRDSYSKIAGDNSYTFTITGISKVTDLISQGTLQQRSDTLLGNMFMLDSYIANINSTRISDNHIEKAMILVKKSGNSLKIAGLTDHL